jgi:hypothetical protein
MEEFKCGGFNGMFFPHVPVMVAFCLEFNALAGGSITHERLKTGVHS